MTDTSYRRFLGPLGWILLVPSALTALGAVWLIATGTHVVGDIRSADGRVVAHQTVNLGSRSSKSGFGGLGERSVVEFSAPDGRKFSVVDSLVRQNSAVHKIGEKVTVRYPAGDPSQAQIGGSAWIKTFIGIVMLIFSGVGVLLGWLLLRLHRKAAPLASVVQ